MNETMTATAYLVRTLWEGGALYLNPEFAQGFGLSHTFGLAGFPNGEAQKSGEHTPKLYIARFYLTQTIGLGGEQEKIEDDLNQGRHPGYFADHALCRQARRQRSVRHEQLRS